MPKKPVVLVARAVEYFSQGDEDVFFGWLDRIACIESYKGVGRELFILFARKPNNRELWELLAICRRYGIDQRQLAQFESARNRHWFRDPKMYWHKFVFGDPMRRQHSARLVKKTPPPPPSRKGRGKD